MRRAKKSLNYGHAAFARPKSVVRWVYEMTESFGQTFRRPCPLNSPAYL